MKSKQILLMINAAFVIVNVLLYVAMRLQPVSSQLLGQLSHDLGVLTLSVGSIVNCLGWCIPLYIFKAKLISYSLPLLGLFVWSYAAYDVFQYEPRYWSVEMVYRNKMEVQFCVENEHGRVQAFRGSAHGSIATSGLHDGERDWIRFKWWRGTIADRPEQPNEVLLKPIGARKGDNVQIIVNEQNGKLVFACAARRVIDREKHKWHSEPETPGVIIAESQPDAP